MLSERSQHVNLPDGTVDDLLARALRVRDLLVGASALLRGANASSPLHELLATARVGAAAVVDTLEQAMAVAAERARNVHAALQRSRS